MNRYECDLLVIGGGLAGFSAALAAAQAGLQVIVLEKTAQTGGSSAMSGGCLAFAGTDLQRAHGIEDSSKLLFDDLVDVGKGECDEALVKLYTDHQLQTYQWLKDNGVVFTDVIEAASGQSVPRVHNVDPADMVRQLQMAALATQQVEVWLHSRARRLLREDGGRVLGASVERNGETVEVMARTTVLLASGGFVQDRALIHRFVPQYDNAVFIGGEGNEGDGLRMAWALGAAVWGWSMPCSVASKKKRWRFSTAAALTASPSIPTACGNSIAWTVGSFLRARWYSPPEAFTLTWNGVPSTWGRDGIWPRSVGRATTPVTGSAWPWRWAPWRTATGPVATQCSMTSTRRRWATLAA